MEFKTYKYKCFCGKDIERDLEVTDNPFNKFQHIYEESYQHNGAPEHACFCNWSNDMKPKKETT